MFINLADLREWIIKEDELQKVVSVLRDEGCGQYAKILSQTIHSRPHIPAASVRDIAALKKAIIEVLDTGFESSELDMWLVLDRIDAWEKGELRQQGEQR